MTHKKETPHPATGGVKVDEARYTLKLSPALDKSLSKMAERMEMDKGRVITHGLVVLALALKNKRDGGGDLALLRKDNKTINRIVPINDNGLPGDLEIANEEAPGEDRE